MNKVVKIITIQPFIFYRELAYNKVLTKYQKDLLNYSLKQFK